MAEARLLRPPELATGKARVANPLELFFDLAYVFVVIALALAFSKDLSWSGAAAFTGLFTMIWFSWIGFTVYANRFDTDDALFRILMLAATLAIAGCAASAVSAVTSLSVIFGTCYLIGRLILLALYLRAWVHVREARQTTSVYVGCATATCLLLAASLAVATPGRFWLWGAAILADSLGPIIASRGENTAPLNMAHLPERFGLFVILVLGEGLFGGILAVQDEDWSGLVVLSAIAGFVSTAALWWAYFDAAALRAEENVTHGEGEEIAAPGIKVDVYVYAHLPVTLGIASAAVGLKGLALHPTLARGPAGWLVIAGLALYFLGLALLMVGTSPETRVHRLWPLLGAAGAVSVLLANTALPAALVAAAVCVIVAVIGTAMQRTRAP